MARSGVVLTGDPFGGKTTAINVLADALGLLEERSLMNEHKVIYSGLSIYKQFRSVRDRSQQATD